MMPRQLPAGGGQGDGMLDAAAASDGASAACGAPPAAHVAACEEPGPPPPVPSTEDADASPASHGRNSRRTGQGEGGPSLVRRLFQAHVAVPRPRPASKELQEAYGFFKKTSGALTNGGRLDLVVDACGGHGMLGMLFVAFGKAERAVVVDVPLRPYLELSFCRLRLSVL